MILTDRALTKLKTLQEGDKGLRVSVVGGGCSGLSYKLSWEDAPSENDKVTTVDGLVIVVDPKSFLFIQGIELDYTDGLDGQGFTFNNPNAKRSCGCGSSFSV
jgi:iron-sulfur cluster assembly protein